MSWQGRRYGLTPYLDGWRLRSRARGDEIDWKFPHMSAAMAQNQALEKFEERTAAVRPKRGTPTLEDLIEAYKEIPKRAGKDAEKQNIYCLRSVVRAALGKELNKVFPHQVGPDLWGDFQKARLDGRLDYSTRRPGNGAINSTVRCAKSMPMPRSLNGCQK